VARGLHEDLLAIYRDNPELDEEQMLAIDEMVLRRSKREPLQYIAGYNDFFGLRLLIGYGVLIPRPETELMAEQAMQVINSRRSSVSGANETTILDVCTGSGCLALGLARELPDARIYGSDISETALSYASMNSRMNGIKNVSFINGNLLDHFGRSDLFDLIISNPPYIRTDDIETLQPEIKDWEPLNALDGGHDGLDFYREIIPSCRSLLKENGILMLELGDGCADAVISMLIDTGYAEVKTGMDYSGTQRIIQAQWTK
jgi:release factor glutamine methyltransferase